MRVIDDRLDDAPLHDPELALYRNRTIAILRKYARMSVALGHLPALMSTEFFRSHISVYGTHTFEDTVIFVHDMERCLDLLPRRYQNVIVTLFFQQYSNLEGAELLGCSHNTLQRWRFESLDTLTEILLERKLLERFRELPVEPLDFEDELEADEDELTETVRPPKKRAQSVETIHAVAIPA